MILCIVFHASQWYIPGLCVYSQPFSAIFLLVHCFSIFCLMLFYSLGKERGFGLTIYSFPWTLSFSLIHVVLPFIIVRGKKRVSMLVMIHSRCYVNIFQTFLLYCCIFIVSIQIFVHWCCTVDWLISLFSADSILH